MSNFHAAVSFPDAEEEVKQTQNEIPLSPLAQLCIHYSWNDVVIDKFTECGIKTWKQLIALSESDISELANAIDWSKATAPQCICRSFMISLTAEDCYGKNHCISCDLCSRFETGDTLVYHCNRGKAAEHEGRYDICTKCAPPSSAEMLIDEIKKLNPYYQNCICFCTKNLKKIEKQNSTSLCSNCCKNYSSNIEFVCQRRKCMFRKLGGNSYSICEDCMENIDLFRVNVDIINEKRLYPTHQLIHNKIMDAMRIIKGHIDKTKSLQELKKYMYSVNWVLYKNWIVKLKETDFGKDEFDDFYKDICTHYQTMYEQTMNKIQVLTNSVTLNLNKSIFIEDDDEDCLSPQQMNELSLKWKSLHDEIEELDNGQNVECYFKEMCASKGRLKLIMEIFDEHFLKRFVDGRWKNINDEADYFEMFEHSLKNYTVVSLLDDFNHLQSFHFDEAPTGECDCEIHHLLQTERDREEERKKAANYDNAFGEYFNCLSYRSRNVLDISVKVHQFLFHRETNQSDEDDDETKQSSKVATLRPLRYQKQREDQNKKTKNKFILEMQSQENNDTDSKRGSIDDLLKVLISNGMSKVNAMNILKYIHANEYDSDSIAFDLAQHERFHNFDQMKLYQLLDENHKYFVKVIKSHFNVKGKDNDNIPIFHFGERQIFYSWHYFQNKPQFKQFCVVPKYKSLKYELLNNGIHAMCIKVFNTNLSKAHILTLSKKGKAIKAKDYASENNKHEVPPFCSISIAHILCLLIYCNCTKTQYEFKKFGTRKSKNNQTLEELKSLNAEISHWYSLLFEAVMFFGSETTPNDTFYTGLDVPLLFDSFSPIFCAPFSTTISYHTALRFCNESGLILKLNQDQSSLFSVYFDVEWMSNFAEERERLFFFVNTLRITDVFTFHQNVRYLNDLLISALNLWSSLFSGHYLLNMLKRKTQKVLIAFIQNFNQSNNLKSQSKIIKLQFSVFMEQIFYNLTQKLNEFLVINQEYDKLYDPLKKELFVHNDNEVSMSPFFGYLRSKNLRNIEFMEEYIWILSKKNIKKLREGKGDKWVYSHSFYFDFAYNTQEIIEFDEDDDDDGEEEEIIEFQIGLRNKSSDKYMEFMFHIIDSSKPMDGKMSICADEINYVQNAIPFYKKAKNECKQLLCFEEKCLMQLNDMLTVRCAVIFFH